MLDDLELVHRRDSCDALGIIEKQWRQLEERFELIMNGPLPVIDTIIYAGMGGMAASAALAKDWLGTGRPFEVLRGYDLPDYAGKTTLCIVASYSGATEETLAILRQALEIGAVVAVITHGGELLELAIEKRLPYVMLPSVTEPRYATWYTVKALATITDGYGLTTGKADELTRLTPWLHDILAAWRPDVPSTRNEAKRVARELLGRSIVVYDGPALPGLAYKWKISFNENAKQVAWCGQYPEFNHNEFLGWTKQPVNKPYAVIDIRSGFDHPRVQKRFELTERLLSGLRPAPIVVRPEGDSRLAQALYAAGLADFVSVYLALLNGIDPTAGTIVNKLKKELS